VPALNKQSTFEDLDFTVSPKLVAAMLHRSADAVNATKDENLQFSRPDAESHNRLHMNEVHPVARCTQL
jgi:hypothetical protein